MSFEEVDVRLNALTTIFYPLLRPDHDRLIASGSYNLLSVASEADDPLGRLLVATSLIQVGEPLPHTSRALQRRAGGITLIKKAQEIFDACRKDGLLPDRMYFSLLGFLRESTRPEKMKMLVFAANGANALEIGNTEFSHSSQRSHVALPNSQESPTPLTIEDTMHVKRVLQQLLDRAYESMEAKLVGYRARGVPAVAIVVDLTSRLGRTLSELNGEEEHLQAIEGMIQEVRGTERIPWNLIIADPVTMMRRLRAAAEATNTVGLRFGDLSDHFNAAPGDGKAHVGAIVRDPSDPTGTRCVAAWCWIAIDDSTV